MQTGRSVQFQQIESVINAYELRGISAFSVYQGKQLLLKYEGTNIEEGAELLNQFLPMLNNSAAIYTLCIYEEFTGRINDKTPYHGSYNFKFAENTPGYNAANNALQAVENKLSELSEKLDRLEVDKELNADDPTINGMDRIGVILSHPLVEKFLPVLMGMMQPDKQQASLPAAVMSGISEESKSFSPELINAVRCMLAATDESEAALIKLGNVAAKDKNKFKKLLTYMSFV